MPRTPVCRQVPGGRRSAALVLLVFLGGLLAGPAATAVAASSPSPSSVASRAPSPNTGPLSSVSTRPAAAKSGEGSGPDAEIRKLAALAGYLAYGIMAMTITWGILTTTGFARRWVDRATMQGGHMLLAVLFLTFGWIHALAYIFQTQQHFSVTEALIPFAGGGTFAVATGIIGLELTLAVAISVWIQRRLTYRRWHLVHWLTYPAFIVSIIHSFLTSTEVRALGIIGMTVVACAVVVVALFVLRAMPGAPVTKARISPVEP